MIPVAQRIIDAGRGDCLNCCIASILELPYEDVPAWVADAYDSNRPHEWHAAFMTWLRGHGFHYLRIRFDDLADWRMLEEAWCVAEVVSQRFPGQLHAVVGTWGACGENGSRQFSIAYDPNPTNRPYLPHDVVAVNFLIPLAPRVPFRKPVIGLSDIVHSDDTLSQSAASTLTPEQRAELARIAHIPPRI